MVFGIKNRLKEQSGEEPPKGVIQPDYAFDIVTRAAVIPRTDFTFLKISSGQKFDGEYCKCVDDSAFYGGNMFQEF